MPCDNSAGSATSNPATLAVLTNLAPTVTITDARFGWSVRPARRCRFQAADRPRRRLLSAPAALRWRIDFHHDTHTHPAMPDTTGVARTFAIPNSGETSANVWYRVYLTATDSAGLATNSFVDVGPNTAMITLTTSRQGSA